MSCTDGTHISLSGNGFNAVGLYYTPNHCEAEKLHGGKDVQTKFKERSSQVYLQCK